MALPLLTPGTMGSWRYRSGARPASSGSTSLRLLAAWSYCCYRPPQWRCRRSCGVSPSLLRSRDTARIQDLLATATTLRQGFTDEDIDELTDEFYTSHPDLAESLEESPALWTLSRTDRKLIVWLVGIIVTLNVGNALLHIGTDMPELKAVIDAFGLDAGGGLPAGITAAAATNEVLKKLPQEEAE